MKSMWLWNCRQLCKKVSHVNSIPMLLPYRSFPKLRFLFCGGRASSGYRRAARRCCWFGVQDGQLCLKVVPNSKPNWTSTLKMGLSRIMKSMWLWNCRQLCKKVSHVNSIPMLLPYRSFPKLRNSFLQLPPRRIRDNTFLFQQDRRPALRCIGAFRSSVFSFAEDRHWCIFHIFRSINFAPL